jgi:hypothetical protein
MPAALAEIAVALWLTTMGGRVNRKFEERFGDAVSTKAVVT